MTISVTIVIQEFAYGNPASLGEPLGLWAGDADVTGNASGGTVVVAWVPENPVDVAGGEDHRRRYVYFVDGIMAECSADMGNVQAVVEMHMARANVALPTRFQHRITRATLATGAAFVPDGELIDPFTHRMPIFWDTQELESGTRILVDLIIETNVLAATYRLRCYGRYYDRQLLFNRSFGRLVAPPPLAPFD